MPKRVYLGSLTLNLLTTTIVAPPSNASKWQMGFNSAFKGLTCFCLSEYTHSHYLLWVTRKCLKNEYGQTQHRYRAEIRLSYTSVNIKKELTESSYSIFFHLQSKVQMMIQMHLCKH